MCPDPCSTLSCELRNQRDTSVPIPKFASPCGTLSCELRNQRDTSNSVILVPLLNPKFATAFAARRVRTSGSGHCRGISIALGVFFAHQDLALAGMVGLADDAFLLHALHQRGRPVVADLQPALDVAGRGLAVAQNDLHRLLVEVAAFRLTHAGRIEHGIAVLVLLVEGGDGLEVLRGALRLEMAHDL